MPLSSAARQTLRFSFTPANATRRETVFFDCALFPDAPLGTCLPRASGPAARGTARAAKPVASPAAAPSSPVSSATASKLPAATGTLKADAESGRLEVR